jgi:hypothetical protein
MWVVSITPLLLYPLYPLAWRLGGPQSRSERRGENSWVYLDSNSDPSVVQPVASRYTDCAIPATRIGSCENGNESSCSSEVREFLAKLSEYQLIRDSAAWNRLVDLCSECNCWRNCVINVVLVSKYYSHVVPSASWYGVCCHTFNIRYADCIPFRLRIATEECFHGWNRLLSCRSYLLSGLLIVFQVAVLMKIGSRVLLVFWESSSEMNLKRKTVTLSDNCLFWVELSSIRHIYSVEILYYVFDISINGIISYYIYLICGSCLPLDILILLRFFGPVA